MNTHRYSLAMSQRRGRLNLLLLATLLVPLLVTACSGGPAAPALPNAAELLSHGADAMRTVKSAAIDIASEPQVTAIPIRSANGHITADGQAEGTAVLALYGGPPLEYQLVVTGGVVYLKGPTGGYSQLPLASAASIYDPTAILNPDKGTAALLAAADKGQTQTRETVDGVDAFKVAATFPAEKVATLVPGVTAPVPGTVWLDAATNRLVRAELQLPDGPNGKGGPVTVRMSDYDAPVTVTAPS
jgi:lipoprotein LprG